MKKCRKVTIEDSVTNFVCNVKRFSPPYKTIFKFDDHYYFNDDPNGPLPNEPIYAMNKILDTLNKYVPDSIILPKFQSISNISYKELLAVSLQRRVIDGDDFSELVQQLNDIPKCNNIDHFKHVAAISGLTMILNENNTFSMIETSALYDQTHLDPLGSDNPAEALQQAAVEYHKNQIKLCEELKEKTLVQQAYQTLSGWGNLLFGNTKSQSNSVNTLIETPQTEALQLCLAYG